MPGRALANYVVGAREGKLASARPGAVRAPPGGLGPFQALAISMRARLHAHVARFRRNKYRFPPIPCLLSPHHIIHGLLSGQGGESNLDSDSVLIGVLRLIGSQMG